MLPAAILPKRKIAYRLMAVVCLVAASPVTVQSQSVQTRAVQEPITSVPVMPPEDPQRLGGSEQRSAAQHEVERDHVAVQKQQVATPRVEEAKPYTARLVKVTNCLWASSGSDLRPKQDSPIDPGESLTATIAFRAPASPGCYQLKIDLVAEGVTWFEPGGTDVVIRPLRVR